MKKLKFKRIVATIRREYLIPMADETHSELDGRTLEEIINEWFKEYDINSSHATREACHLGNSDKVIEAHVEDFP